MHLLDDFYPDNHMRTIWSLESTISYWLRVESELAGALADADIISIEDARMISQACSLEKIDISRLILESKNVGYPIVSLVSMICEALPANQAG